MASPRRARSLFLSPDKAELLAAKEINGLVNRVEVIPRKPVPRQGRQSDIVEKGVGGGSRNSSTSSIKAVDTFCDEYRPPSVALHRLSNLNKDLPPSPSSETPNQDLYHGTATSRTSTRKHAAAQTVISVQSRYSTRIKPSTPSRLSVHSSHIASQHRDSEDRISIRSHFSTQDSATGQAVPRSEPSDGVTIDRRQRSVAEDPSKKYVERQRSGSVSPGTVSPGTPPHQEPRPAVVGREIQVPRLQEAEKDPRIRRDIQDPRNGTDSRKIALRTKSKRETSVGWNFQDGFILRTGERHTGSKGDPPRGEDLRSEPRSRPIIPIRWTFRDGIIYKASVVRSTANGGSQVRSKRLKPIVWSFYDGLTIRPDGSVRVISKTTGESSKIVHGSRSKAMIPIGWTFHEGLIFAGRKSAGGGSVTDSSKHLPIGWTFHEGLTITKRKPLNSTLTSSDRNSCVEKKGSSKRLPVTWTFHEGLKFVTHESIKSTPFPSDRSNGPHPDNINRRPRITWTFHEGIAIGTHETRKRDMDSFGKSNRTQKEASAKRLPIAWTFYDGLSLGSLPNLRDTTKEASNTGESGTESRSKRTIGWTFNEGLVFKNVAGVLPPEGMLGVITPQEICQVPGTSSPEVGLVALAGGISDETTGSILTKPLASNPPSDVRHDEHAQEAVVNDEPAGLSVSPPDAALQERTSIEEICRARAVALAQRQNRHQSPSELHELILEGQLIYDQFRQQAQKLQKQKVLVDEMLTILGSSSKENCEARTFDTDIHTGANDPTPLFH